MRPYTMLDNRHDEVGDVDYDATQDRLMRWLPGGGVKVLRTLTIRDAQEVAMESLSVQVTPELKRALREQAERAGMTLSEWVRTRLELEASIDPDEVRAFLLELGETGKRMKRTFADGSAPRLRMRAARHK